MNITEFSLTLSAGIAVGFLAHNFIVNEKAKIAKSVTKTVVDAQNIATDDKAKILGQISGVANDVKTEAKKV